MLVICLLLSVLICPSVVCYISVREKLYFPDSQASWFLFRFCQRKALQDERKRELTTVLTLVSCGVSESRTAEETVLVVATAAAVNQVVAADKKATARTCRLPDSCSDHWAPTANRRLRDTVSLGFR